MYEVDEMTKRGVPGVWTYGYYDGWAPNYLFYIANGHNSIGRFYETFGGRGADTGERTVPASQTSREWFRPNPPLASQVGAPQQHQHAGERHAARHEPRGHEQGTLPGELLPQEQALRLPRRRTRARPPG